MKVRTDFVTNSSSSSFVLVFKDEYEYKEFDDECYDSGYEEFFTLANRNKTSKKQCNFTCKATRKNGKKKPRQS